MKLLLTTYWSQTLLLITFITGIVTFFYQKHHELKLKKQESKHNFFQQNKLNTVLQFFKSYTALERAIFHISTHKLLAKEYTAEELDVMLKSLINDLQIYHSHLHLFLSESEVQLFTEIKDGILTLYGYYAFAFMNNPISSEINYEKANLLKNRRDEIFELNKALMQKIGNQLRVNFASE